jgi:hypothetical protein
MLAMERPPICDGDIVVLQEIADDTDNDTGICKQKRTTIAADTGRSVSAVRDSLGRLVAAGLLGRRCNWHPKKPKQKLASDYWLVSEGVGQPPDLPRADSRPTPRAAESPVTLPVSISNPVSLPPPAGVAVPAIQEKDGSPEPDELAGFIARRLQISRADLAVMLPGWRQSVPEERLWTLAKAYAPTADRKTFLAMVAELLPRAPSVVDIALHGWKQHQETPPEPKPRTTLEAWLELQGECRARKIELRYPLSDGPEWKAADKRCYRLRADHLETMLRRLREGMAWSEVIVHLESSLMPQHKTRPMGVGG